MTFLFKVDKELFLSSNIPLNKPENNIKGTNENGVEIGGDGHVLGTDNYNLILQEVWFATMISAIVILLIIIFGAVICVKRRKSLLKNSLGNYNGKIVYGNTYTVIKSLKKILQHVKYEPLLTQMKSTYLQIMTIYGLIPTGNTLVRMHLQVIIGK